MADTHRRLKDKASAYFSKGRYEKALLAWQEVVAAEPGDLPSRLRLGDTFRRLGRPAQALSCYGEVADSYARDGLLLKAIAVCKLILEVDPDHTGTQELLADLYARKYGHPPPPPPEARRAAPPALDAFEAMVDEDGEDDAAEEVVDLDALDDEPIDVAGIEPPAPPPKPEPRELPVIPLFSDLERAAFLDLMSKMRLVHLEPGETVVREGEQGEAFFVVASGTLVVRRDVDGAPVDLARLGEGHFFGEMALLSSAPRSATVTAETEAEVFELDRVLLEGLAARHPPVEEALKRFYRQRLLANLMATSPLFRPFDRPARRDLVARFNAVEAGPGEIVVSEGAPSGGLFVIMSGEVAVTKGEGFEETTLARLKEGDVFGEMSVLTHAPANATVRTLRTSVFLRLPSDAFQELMMTHPQILELVSALTEARARQNEAAAARIDDEGLLLF